MQTLTNDQLLAEIQAVTPLVKACEQSPETRRILRELELGHRNLIGDFIASAAREIVERTVALSRLPGCSDLANRLDVIGRELQCRENYKRVNPGNALGLITNTITKYWDLRGDLSNWPELEVFEFLFPIACDCTAYPTPVCDRAAILLVRLDPRCPLTCEEALMRIGEANLEVSLREVPFYLVTQFGKYNVLEAIEKLLSGSDLSERARQNVGTVKYWTRGLPPCDLFRGQP